MWESVTANSMDILEQIRTILSMNSVYDMVVSFLRLGEVESQTEMATYVLFTVHTDRHRHRQTPTPTDTDRQTPTFKSFFYPDVFSF